MPSRVMNRNPVVWTHSPLIRFYNFIDLRQRIMPEGFFALGEPRYHGWAVPKIFVPSFPWKLKMASTPADVVLDPHIFYESSCILGDMKELQSNIGFVAVQSRRGWRWEIISRFVLKWSWQRWRLSHLKRMIGRFVLKRSRSWCIDNVISCLVETIHH